MSGMLRVEQHERNGWPWRRAAVSASSAALAARHGRRLHPPAQQLRVEDAPVDGVVVDDQHAARSCERAARRSGSRRDPRSVEAET